MAGRTFEEWIVTQSWIGGVLSTIDLKLMLYECWHARDAEIADLTSLARAQGEESMRERAATACGESDGWDMNPKDYAKLVRDIPLTDKDALAEALIKAEERGRQSMAHELILYKSLVLNAKKQALEDALCCCGEDEVLSDNVTIYNKITALVTEANKKMESVEPLAEHDRQVRLEEFEYILENRPIDPCYWDTHHRAELRAGKKEPHCAKRCGTGIFSNLPCQICGGSGDPSPER